jgi:Tfp pilus assembly protein PilO
MGFNIKNRKNSILFLVFISAAALFFYFMYFPKAKEVRSLTAEYKNIKGDLDELYAFIGGEENLKDNIVKMRKDFARLEQAFPYEKEASNIIKYVNTEAKRFNVNVRSLNPKDLYFFKDDTGNSLMIEGCLCKCMPLSLTVEARYQALGEFLERLELAESPVISVESINAAKNENIKPLINARVEIVGYLSGK